MGDIALRGEPLKKMMALAKKRDMNFAYCPGNDPKEDVFVLDRKKKPEVIARVARSESTGTKLGFGTAKVKGRVISLTCERELPQMAKKLKKFLKFEKIPMNVLVLDENGNVLEQDIEDLPDDDGLEDVADDDSDADDADAPDAPQAAAQDAPDAPAPPDDAEQLKKIKAHALQVQNAIKKLGPDAQAALIPRFKTAVGAMQGGDLIKAVTMLATLEKAIAKLSATAPAAAAPQDIKDPVLARLSQASGVLSKRLDQLGEINGVARLRAAHEILINQIDAGDAKKATSTVKSLDDAITRLADQTVPAAGQTPPEGAAEAPDGLGIEWRDARAELEPALLDLMQRGVGDVSKMRAVLAYFTEKGEAMDFAGALKAVPGLKKLMADARTVEQTAAEKDIPKGVVPYVRARLDWSKTRISLKSEIKKLQDAILAVCQGEDFPTIVKDSEALFGYLNALDNKLEDALEDLVQEPDGDKREKLKDIAREILKEYQRELETPFFQAVDGKNGFKAINVRGAALASLGKVSDALRTAA